LKYFSFIFFLYFFLGPCNRPNTLSYSGDPKEVFNKFCADCHGNDGEEFATAEWQAKAERTKIFTAIKEGIIVEGMPAYGETMTDKQIYALSDFILNLSKKEQSEANSSNVQKKENIKTNLIIEDLDKPWGLVILPNGKFLVTERSGELILITNYNEKKIIDKLPPIWSNGQGGLLDIILHPKFEENNIIYCSYSKPQEDNNNYAATAIFKAKLNTQKFQLEDVEDIFIALPYHNTGRHFGSRMIIDNDNYLYVSVGDRGNRDVFPQSLENGNGNIHRINLDGSIPESNPFNNTPNAVKSIYSYGHRNPQGLVYDKANNKIWTNEHGPKGGDEINLVEAGKNYGWPIVSFGINYTGTVFTELTTKKGMEDPDWYWVPSIAPCGMAFISSDKYPQWQGDILNGSLKFDYVMWTDIEDGKIIKEEPLFENIGRVRNVVEASDGFIYVAVEGPGRIYKVITE